MRKTLACATLLGALALPAWAGEAQPNAENPAIEARLNALAKDLRCLVCQNESLAGSRADLAEDLRREIREQMLEGKSDAEVVQYLTERYGDFVLYRPPVKPVTYLLWGGPLIILAIGGLIWYTALQRRRSMRPNVSTEELQRAARLLEAEEPKP
jgi:cytochrome c-type biogenesis protein CcmH